MLNLIVADGGISYNHSLQQRCQRHFSWVSIIMAVFESQRLAYQHPQEVQRQMPTSWLPSLFPQAMFGTTAVQGDFYQYSIPPETWCFYPSALYPGLQRSTTFEDWDR